MGGKATQLFKYTGNNPFNDSQGRNFSDSKIQNEFYPISRFWSLFNDHHEILIGTRGSGKTFLLKMMRRSMLKNIKGETANRIIEDRIFFPLYVPLHMETVAALLDDNIPNEKKVILFKFVFNSILAESLLAELSIFIEESVSEEKKTILEYELSKKIKHIWYPGDNSKSVMDLQDLGIILRGMTYNFDYLRDSIDTIPVVFKQEYASPLISIQPILNKMLNLTNEATWIVCVDEAEFIPELFQKSLNSFMRSHTNRIALKIATLPFYWTSLDTLDYNIRLSPENDFNYQILDMDCNSEDFIHLTNKLCSHRINTRVALDLQVESLEDFLGKIGNDNLIDYYRNSLGEEKAEKKRIEMDIRESFSDIRKEGAKKYSNPEKTIFQKFAPTLYVREIYKEMHKKGKGRFNPGWYAGADVVRKVSQGNPRLFIRLMSSLFTRATSTNFTEKTQQEVILKFAEDFCNASKAIEVDGPSVFENLDKTGNYLSAKVHLGPLISVGTSFKYRYESKTQFDEWRKWIQRAAAFSKITISDESLIQGINEDTVIILSNAYAVFNWIPMRTDGVQIIPTDFNIQEEANKQMSLFDY